MKGGPKGGIRDGPKDGMRGGPKVEGSAEEKM